MINIQFKSIWMLSRKDERARTVHFHPKKNLLIGKNHTGKSSLIKTLFLTLGARAHGKLDRWDSETISVVKFSVNTQIYLAVHQNRNRAIFNESGQLLGAATSHEKWSEIFAQVVHFNLVLTDKNQETVPADSRCFFLPFYINQDGSWTSSWDTFDGLQQYSKPTTAILDYFSGIKPPKYYEINSEKSQLQNALVELQKENRFLGRARERFEKAMPISTPKIIPGNFDEEIKKLNVEMVELNSLQEILRDKVVRENEIVTNIELQIGLAKSAIETYQKDSNYLRTEPRENLVCPTCGAEHAESFLELLTYAEDARVLVELVARLQHDLIDARERYQSTFLKLSDLQSNYSKISELLEIRKGDLQFSDVVNSLGAESAFQAFDSEGVEIKSEIDARLSSIETLDEGLKALTDSKRSKEILQVFRQSIAGSFVSLNLPFYDTSRIRLSTRPDISGSGGPRSVLAYYGALWKVCYGEYGAFQIPIVIDSPNQQGQDQFNMPKVLQYIASELPSQAQIIVGTEIDSDYPFDSKLQFEEPYKLLREEEYSEVLKFVDPLINLLLAEITKENLAKDM